MKYSANPEKLNELDMAQLAWNAIEPLWEDLPYSNAKELYKFLSEITEGQKALISIDWCQKEIRNGGLKQLFTNSTGNLVPFAITGFNKIGAKKYASLLLEATSIFGVTYPSTVSGRKKALKELGKAAFDKLEKIDDEFFSLLQTSETDLEIYRGVYVRNNLEQFTGS
jgi:hypothetical protein